MDLAWTLFLLAGLTTLKFNASGLVDSFFTEDDQFQDKLPAGFSATSSSVHSAGACALFCGRLTAFACRGFFYNEGSKTCRMTSEQFVTQGNEVAAPGYRYYQMKPKPCPAGSWVHNESSACFKLYTQPTLNWMDARDACAINGGRLACMDTTSKMVFLMNIFTSGQVPNGKTHVGGHRPYNRWGTSYPGNVPDEIWLNNVPVNWTEFKAMGLALASEPNYPANEAVLNVNGGKLGNDPPGLTNFLKYMCEYAM